MKLRKEKRMKLVAKINRGSGDCNALRFSPGNSGKGLMLASLYTSKTDIYNRPGNFLITSLDPDFSNLGINSNTGKS